MLKYSVIITACLFYLILQNDININDIINTLSSQYCKEHLGPAFINNKNYAYLYTNRVHDIQNGMYCGSNLMVDWRYSACNSNIEKYIVQDIVKYLNQEIDI